MKLYVNLQVPVYAGNGYLPDRHIAKKVKFGCGGQRKTIYSEYAHHCTRLPHGFLIKRYISRTGEKISRVR